MASIQDLQLPVVDPTWLTVSFGDRATGMEDTRQIVLREHIASDIQPEGNFKD